MRRYSRVDGCSPSVSTFKLSLVSPQPVALQRLNRGTRISSRIDGRPTMRIAGFDTTKPRLLIAKRQAELKDISGR